MDGPCSNLQCFPVMELRRWKKENNLTEEKVEVNSLIDKIKAEVKALKRLFDMVQILDHCISHS
jgi:hypothetical protein